MVSEADSFASWRTAGVSPTFTEWMMDGIWPQDISPKQAADMIDYYVKLVGVDHVGPYMEIGGAFAKVKTQFPDGELAGIYYDNPEFVPEDSLRSFAGVKVSATEGLEVIAAHPGFRLVEIEKGPALYTEWSGGTGVVSIILGTMKAYPALKAACEETGLCTENSIAFEEYSDAGTRYVMTY